MDVDLPGITGIEATRQIKATVPSAQVVILSGHEADVYRASATAAGASAYVPKRTLQIELLPTLAALLSTQEESENMTDET